MSSLLSGQAFTVDVSNPPFAPADAVSKWVDSPLRRTFDLCAAATALLLCWPLLVLITCAVRLGSKGPALFRQRRIGQFGREFTLYKFRSMVVSKKPGAPITVRGDARVTRVGAVLRRYKLDELPQLWNVLKGEMSLVGPRPKLPHHEGLQLFCRPGLTGTATLAFRNEEELLSRIPVAKMEELYDACVKPAKARLDCQYMRRASFASDCWILWKTLVSCLLPGMAGTTLSEELQADGRADPALSPFPCLEPHELESPVKVRPERSRNWRGAPEQALILLMLVIPIKASAQKNSRMYSAVQDPSRFDLFAGYTDWNAHGEVLTSQFLGSNTGIDVSGAWYFNQFHRRLGAEVDARHYYNERNDALESLSVGPVYRFPETHGFTGFFHVLGGAARVASPPVPFVVGQPTFGIYDEKPELGQQFTVGAGLDYDLSGFHRRLAARVFQADYLYDYARYGPDREANLNSLTLSIGLVLHLGSSPAAASKSCASPRRRSPCVWGR